MLYEVITGRLSGVDYLETPTPAFRREEAGVSSVLEAIEDYLQDPAAGFDVDLQLEGTPFQQRVWRELSAIPPGETLV